MPLDCLFLTLRDSPHQAWMEVSVAAMQKRLKEAFAVARHLTSQEAARQRHYYDRRAVAVALQPGDVVMVRSLSRNKVFREALQKLGMVKLIHSPPYRPQSNGRIEGFHRYLKACIAKHMRNDLEWDQIMAMATAAYNYFPNMSAKESVFFLTYGRDPMNKLSSILNAPRRYLCNDSGLPDLEALKNMYQMVAQQLCNSRQRYIKDNKYNKVPDHGILVGDLVLMKDHTAKSFKPKYKEDY